MQAPVPARAAVGATSEQHFRDTIATYGGVAFAGTINGDVNLPSHNEDDRCLIDLRPTDPRDDKKRIEQTKGGLLEGAYRWILDHEDFRRWRDDDQSRLLWIKGDPGKGKTMLLCGVLDHLRPATKLTDPSRDKLLSYFFCQATDDRIKSATAVLRGLIYLLVDQHPPLLAHVRKKYDHAGKALFEDANAWVALSGIFVDIVQDTSLGSAYLVVDALDECETELPKLLDLIVQNLSPRVKWIVSSRNRPDIEEDLEVATQKLRLCLELNEQSISAAVNIYIEYKVLKLADKKKYTAEIRDAVQYHLSSKANDTFLWVALVCQRLEQIPRWNLLETLSAFPPGLTPLYMRMMEQIPSHSADLCRKILGIMTTVFRPLAVEELTSLVEVLEDLSIDFETSEELIKLCGSFLTLRERTISFVHQSAKDFLLAKAFDKIFPSGIEDVHHTIFSRSLQLMSRTLRRDIYGLGAPGFPIDQVTQPNPDPLATARYSCIYWIDHLRDCNPSKNASEDLQDSSLIDNFLRQKYLHWLEALSLLRSMSEGVASMLRLEGLLQAGEEISPLIDRARDASRFIRYHKWAIENSPLQVYASALVFSPARSITRNQFREEEPEWIIRKPAMANDWNACLQTLEGHSDAVCSVAWSHDGARLASASDDNMVKIWDPATGQCVSTLEGHSDAVCSVAWSHDAARLASASSDYTVKIWDPATGQCVSTLEGHSDAVYSAAWSYDAARLASASFDNTVKIWDPATGQCVSTLEGHSYRVYSVAWSYDAARLASASDDNMVKIWDPATGQCVSTIDVGGTPDYLQFDASSFDLLHTEFGTFDLRTVVISTVLDPAAPNRFFPLAVRYGLSSNLDWITYQGQKLLWLPPEHRASCSAISGTFMSIGCSSGRVLIMTVLDSNPIL